jgi:hypothetical protein
MSRAGRVGHAYVSGPQRGHTLSVADDAASVFPSLNMGHHREWSHSEISPKVFERLDAAEEGRKDC